MENFLSIRVKKHLNLLENLNKHIYQVFNELSNSINNTLNNGNKIISFGNGGSAADSIHFTGELVSKYKSNRKSLPAISLNSNISVLTSISNDFGYEKVFSRQLESLYKEGDFVICITTSGNSKNIINAIRFLNQIKANYFTLTGESGGKSKEISKKILKVPSDEVDIIQEIHYMILHSICDGLEK